MTKENSPISRRKLLLTGSVLAVGVGAAAAGYNLWSRTAEPPKVTPLSLETLSSVVRPTEVPQPMFKQKSGKVDASPVEK